MRYLVFVFFLNALNLFGQYDPAGGLPGSRSIHKDDAAIIAWAESINLQRGWLDIADTTAGRVTAGSDSLALGKADGRIVSLGDGGSATFYFAAGIINQPGFDLAVFENGFKAGDGYYLELAFVEVSIDGISYFRFPSATAQDSLQQLSNADVMYPERYYNLAGKHQAPYGTLFDLDDLNVDTVYYVRVVDVVGSIDSLYGNRDAAGRIINDPYPTAFFSGGFDLDAVAVVQGNLSYIGRPEQMSLNVYPSPLKAGNMLCIDTQIPLFYRLIDMQGREVQSGSESKLKLEIPGMYWLQINIQDQIINKKICVY